MNDITFKEFRRPLKIFHVIELIDEFLVIFLEKMTENEKRKSWSSFSKR